MLNPDMSRLSKEGENRYELVLKVAKRARKIASKAEEEKNILTEKPVSLAIEELSQD